MFLLEKKFLACLSLQKSGPYTISPLHFIGPTLTPLSQPVTPTLKFKYAYINVGEDFNEIPQVLPFVSIRS